MSKVVKKCALNQSEFTLDQNDIDFLDRLSPIIAGVKYSLPLPRFSPAARLQRRLNWRTEFNFFKRKSDFSGKEIISQFPADTKFPVYTLEEWLSDGWDPLTYAKDIDPHQSFFDQFNLLNQQVPKPALGVHSSENCEYINSASYNKNCYLIAAASQNEHCFYGVHLQRCFNCFDCGFILDCNFCYQCIDCINCNELKYSWNCHDCSESSFLHSCKNCQNCFASVNLKNKQYVFFNQQLDQKTYFEKLNLINLSSYSMYLKVKDRFEKHRLNFPYSHFIGTNNEHVFGNNISNSKNVWNCFDVTNLQDCRYCIWFHKANDCMDCYSWGISAELCYECISCGDNAFQCLFCSSCYACSNLIYCNSLRSSKNCFGCVGLRNKEYCIFNKQYSKNDYEKIVPKLIDKMIRDQEWGEFFPFNLSDSYYNCSIAQLYFPLNSESAKQIGANWINLEESLVVHSKKLPDNLSEVGREITKDILACQSTGKTYRIVPQEFKFYSDFNICLPRDCPEERHRQRIMARLPRQLWKRKCEQSNQDIFTAYSPERKERIWEYQQYLKDAL